MSLYGDYDGENIFAKMLRGEVPCIKVFEDDVAFAFMDIFPQASGHTLVIPKGVRARNFLEMPPEKVGPYMERVQTVTNAVAKGLEPDGIVVTQFNGASAGQTVFHLHFHILPKYENLPFERHGHGQQADPEVLEVLAQKIRAAL